MLSCSFLNVVSSTLKPFRVFTWILHTSFIRSKKLLRFVKHTKSAWQNIFNGNYGFHLRHENLWKRKEQTCSSINMLLSVNIELDIQTYVGIKLSDKIYYNHIIYINNRNIFHWQLRSWSAKLFEVLDLKSNLKDHIICCLLTNEFNQ